MIDIYVLREAKILVLIRAVEISNFCPRRRLGIPVAGTQLSACERNVTNLSYSGRLALRGLIIADYEEPFGPKSWWKLCKKLLFVPRKLLVWTLKLAKTQKL